LLKSKDGEIHEQNLRLEREEMLKVSISRNFDEMIEHNKRLQAENNA